MHCRPTEKYTESFKKYSLPDLLCFVGQSYYLPKTNILSLTSNLFGREEANMVVFGTCLYVGIAASIRDFFGSRFVLWESKVRDY